MNQEETNLAKLLAKYLNYECNDSEMEELRAWLSKSKENQNILDELTNAKTLENDLIQYNSFDKEIAWKKISTHFREEKANIFKVNFKKYLLVASIVSVLFSVSFLYFKYNISAETKLSKLTEGKVLINEVGEILPATTGAILVTSNGAQVNLDDSFILKEDGSITLDGEDLVHNQNSNTAESYYELIVPKAKIINFTLFDGSKIWVNANTRLKIPSKTFNNERRLKLLSGEVYLEVEKYNDSKFIVETQNGEVEVLGTKFNVNSTNSIFKTTLLEGSVKLSNQNSEKILVPNTSGILHSGEFMISKANLLSDLAWKNNTFYFNNYSIKRIAEQIENWYGVQVRIESNILKSKQTYSGEIRRDVKLIEIEKMLEFISGLEITIDGEELKIE